LHSISRLSSHAVELGLCWFDVIYRKILIQLIGS